MVETIRSAELRSTGSGTVFMDNLTLASVKRLIFDHYRDQLDIMLGVDESARSRVILNDLANLANFVEAIVCHDLIVTNAEFAHIWESTTDEGLNSGSLPFVKGLELSKDELTAIRVFESESRYDDIHDGASSPQIWSARTLAQPPDLGMRLSHCLPGDRKRTKRDAKAAQMRADTEAESRAALYKKNFLADRRTAGSRDYLLPGSGLRYYIACSGLLGVPFRPSALRASILASGLSAEVERWRATTAAEVPMAILDEERSVVLKSQISKLFEINVTNAHAPAVLSFILSAASKPEDILQLALQLRESSEAIEYRRWSGELSSVIQEGSIEEVARYLRELERITSQINRRYGLSPAEKGAELALGWGPLEVRKPVSLPAIFATPLRVRRHLWILYNLYKFMLTSHSWALAVDRVLLSHFPEQLRDTVAKLDLNEFREIPRRFA